MHYNCYILKYQKILKSFFASDKWNKLTLVEKEKILYTSFHRNNWIQINPSNRIIILQELENIIAKKEQRHPYTVSIKSKEYSNYLDDMLLDSEQKKILIRYELLYKGLKTVKKDTLIDISDRLNCSILDYFIHEQKHIRQIERKKQISEKQNNNINIPDNYITDEDSEIYLFTIINPKHKNQKNKKTYIKPESSYFEYCMQPTEFYAFLDAETKINSIFLDLEMLFGKDTGYQKWKNDKTQYKKDLIDIYKKKNNIPKPLTYFETYKMNVIERAKKISEWYHMSLLEVLDYFNISIENEQVEEQIVNI